MEILIKFFLGILSVYFFIKLAIIWQEHKDLIDSYIFRKESSFLDYNNDEIINNFNLKYFALSAFILGVFLFVSS
ncbi:hypothetical protein [Tenacibaculum jejuense]|uniref:hypothetical protein n=1 Tax=Tenacibaculum jejuense TaxID=584609 RepID=UPI000BA2DF68|nr:hypothetical protein [Tenacibaculum jejuense]